MQSTEHRHAERDEHQALSTDVAISDPRSLDPCPVCGATVLWVTAGNETCWAGPCGDAVHVTMHRGRLELDAPP